MVRVVVLVVVLRLHHCFFFSSPQLPVPRIVPSSSPPSKSEENVVHVLTLDPIVNQTEGVMGPT